MVDCYLLRFSKDKAKAESVGKQKQSEKTPTQKGRKENQTSENELKTKHKKLQVHFGDKHKRLTIKMIWRKR